MGFYELYNQYKNLNFDKEFKEVSVRDIQDSLSLGNLNIEHLIALLSPQAANHLEAMAQKAHEITLRLYIYQIIVITVVFIADLTGKIS
jgi:2-iminoacetate synthase